MNQYLETVVVCPLTSKIHPKWRTRLQIKCAPKKAEIAVDQIRTISKQRLKKKSIDYQKSRPLNYASCYRICTGNNLLNVRIRKKSRSLKSI
jgi:hypothetical protein